MTFYVYLDESGDEGLSYDPPPQRRGTEWFIISAVISERAEYKPIPARFVGFKRTHNKQSNWHFHFVRASHDDRIGYLSWLNELPVVCMSVIVHKPSLKNREAFALPHRLYCYAARILFERISWYCRKRSEHEFAVMPEAEMVFSQRRGLTQNMIRDYIRALDRQTTIIGSIDPAFISNSIDWGVIDAERAYVEPHSSLVGLQLADATASSIAKALEVNQYGLTEHRYVKLLKPVLYRRYNTFRSYGLKFFPHYPADLLTEPRYHWLTKFK